MSRPFQTSDDDLLSAAARVLGAEGPMRFTLARAAAEAGVSAATFVKRFGSKERLFLRLTQRWVAGLDEQLELAAHGLASPVGRFRAVALHNYRDLDNPSTASQQLASLALDLQNTEMSGWLHVGWGHVRTHLARHARDADSAGELVGAPAPEQLARITAAAMEGGCLLWAVHPTDSLVDRLTADLDALLSGWRVEDSSTSTRRAPTEGP